MKEINSVEICAQLHELLSVNIIAMKVHSVFDSSVNIIRENLFFSLLSGKSCLFPMTCRLQDGIYFPDLGIKEGMEVTWSEDIISIPDADLEINLKNNKIRNLLFDKKEELLIPTEFELKLKILKDLIEDKGCEYDLSTLVTGKFRNPYADLVIRKLPGLEEAIRNNAEQAGIQAGGLAGCGIGLTPSSDDMLIGYMSVYRADSMARGFRMEEIDIVTNSMGTKASEHTNTISGAFLKQCGIGLFSEDMSKLLRALYSDTDADTVRRCGQDIQNFGSTSGTDILTGVVLAMISLASREFPGYKQYS
ncbi:MAG: DUF2877 domain-containing protein [Mobilitalea sp.]